MTREAVDVHAALRDVARYWDVVRRAALACPTQPPTTTSTHNEEQYHQQQQEGNAIKQYQHHTGQLLHTMERLLKSCRATLVAQLAALRNATAQQPAVSYSDCYSGTSVRDTEDKVCRLLLGTSRRGVREEQGKEGTSNATEEMYAKTQSLARRVWVWSLCVSLLRGSLTELSATLDMAQELFSLYSMYCRGNTNSRTVCEERHAGLFFAVSSSSSHGDDDAVTRTSSQDTLHRKTKKYVRDALVVHACVLLYNTVMQNGSAAEAGLRRWEDLLAHLTQRGEQGGTLVVTEEEDEAREERQGEVYFCRSIAFVTKCLAAEEYAVVASYLTTNTTEHTAIAAQHEEYNMAACCPCVLLLLHVLFVHALRRRWLTQGSSNSNSNDMSITAIGAAFRPRIEIDLTKCAAPAVYRDCTEAALERIVHELQQLQLTSTTSADDVSEKESSSKYDAALRACLRLQHDHMPESCYPWPLPSDLVTHVLLHYTLDEHMSIEVCEFLRPSLKAKVQDCGVLYLSDLLLLLRQCGVLRTSEGNKEHTTQSSVAAATLTSGEANTTHNGLATCNNNDSSSMQASLLAERLPRLTKLELADLITSTQRYLQTLNIQSQHAQPSPGAATAVHAGAAAACSDDTLYLPELSVAPMTCAIRTLSELRATAIAALQGGRTAHHATTFSRSLDTLLGGGAAVGELTELSGPPGAGKTQLLLQFAVSCVLPVELGGLKGECLFVDTEGSFAAERFLQLVVAAVALVQDLAARYTSSLSATATPNGVMRSDAQPVQGGGRVGAGRKARRGRKRRRRGNATQENSGTRDTRHGLHERAAAQDMTPAMTARSEEGDERSCYTVSSAPPCSQSSNPASGCCSYSPTQVPPPPPQQQVEHEKENKPEEEEDKQTRDAGNAPRAKDLRTLAAEFTVEYVLRRVHYVRITDLTTFMAFLYSLPAALQKSDRDNNSHNNNTNERDREQPIEAVHGEDGSDDDDDASAQRLPSATLPSSLAKVKMVVIDSIAQPFRSFAALNEGGEEGTTASGHTAGRPATAATMMMMRGAASGTRTASSERERLWRRSRLIFTCAQRLQDYAARFRLAIVVSNQVTSRTLTLPPTDTITHSNSNNSSAYARQRTTILIPALGDAWGYGVGTRVLLSFHHYLLPSCAAACETGTCEAHVCAEEKAAGRRSCTQEDMALCFVSAPHTTTTTTSTTPGVINDDNEEEAAAARRAVDNVHQHRVARLLKSPTEPRGECCFAITRKGIRDVYLLRSAEQVDTVRGRQP